jgi:hypothetical protein
MILLCQGPGDDCTSNFGVIAYHVRIFPSANASIYSDYITLSSHRYEHPRSSSAPKPFVFCSKAGEGLCRCILKEFFTLWAPQCSNRGHLQTEFACAFTRETSFPCRKNWNKNSEIVQLAFFITANTSVIFCSSVFGEAFADFSGFLLPLHSELACHPLGCFRRVFFCGCTLLISRLLLQGLLGTW